MRDPAHYLKPLRTTKTPKRLLWLECAAATKHERGLNVARWHCGALGTTHYTSRKHDEWHTQDTYTHALELWKAADVFCTPNRRVTLFAYDLAYQLRISEALVHLPALGWRLEKIVLERTAAWALFRDGKRSLMMCDLKSWAPVEFGTYAADVLGDDDGTRHIDAGPDWQPSRCIHRMGVVRRAALQILNWIECEGLGGFKPTGSGQSYGAFRRRFMTHHILVHDDEQRLQMERHAMWTGRCEAWRHGTVRDGPFVEYDMQAAYCRIAAQCDVPTIALGGAMRATASRLEYHMAKRAVLAECTVTTDIPVVPTKLGNRTVWPTGTFDTVLWDPELRLALQYARDVKVHRIWRYQREPALQEFARYTLDAMRADPDAYGRVPQRVLKHWSRCLVGRLGLHFRTWEHFGTQDTPDLRLITYADIDTGEQTDMLIAGHRRMILTDMREATDSLPQIPGWVMSECRRRLWEAMVSVGLANVVYVDTDSIVTTPGGVRHSTDVLGSDALVGWADKGRYARMTIHGPRNLVCETTRRVSGLPLTAKQVAPLEFTGQVMRSIKESMRAGELDAVASIPRKFVLDAPDMRRQHLPYGATAPFHVQPTPNTQECE